MDSIVMKTITVNRGRAMFRLCGCVLIINYNLNLKALHYYRMKHSYISRNNDKL